MATKDFTITLLSDQSPEEVFNTIKHVRSWWSGIFSEEIEGTSDQLDEDFTFRAGDGAHYSVQKLIEFIPNEKISWLVTDSRLTFVENESEWTGSKISFEISKKKDKTIVVFTHFGLVPECECYNACSGGWSKYVQEKLLPLINQKQK